MASTKELIEKKTNGKSDNMYVRNLPVDRPLVIKKTWNGEVKREQKDGMYGKYMSCWSMVESQGVKYSCYMPEVVADVLDSIKVGEEIEVKAVWKENPKTKKPFKTYEVRKLSSSSSIPIESKWHEAPVAASKDIQSKIDAMVEEIKVTPMKLPTYLSITDKQQEFIGLFLTPDAQDHRESSIKDVKYFIGLYRHCVMDNSTDDQITLLHKYFVDFMAVNGYN